MDTIEIAKIAYADPPYLGCEHYYPEHEPVDHNKLIEDLNWNYDGWALSCHSPSLFELLKNTYLQDRQGVIRIGAWVKPFASFKPNVNPAYAWEPVIYKPVPRRFSRDVPTVRDWVSANITMKKGVVGAKPLRFCFWIFQILRAVPTDEFYDLFPGSGIVTKAWHMWCEQHSYKQQTMEM